MGKEISSINILPCLIISWGWVVPKYQCFMWLRPLYIATQSHPVYRSHYVRESKVYLTNWRIYCCRILFLEKMFLLVSQQSANEIFPFNCLMYISSEDCQVERAGKKILSAMVCPVDRQRDSYFLLSCWLMDCDDIHNWGESRHQFPFSTCGTKGGGGGLPLIFIEIF